MSHRAMSLNVEVSGEHLNVVFNGSDIFESFLVEMVGLIIDDYCDYPFHAHYPTFLRVFWCDKLFISMPCNEFRSWAAIRLGR